MTPNGIVLEGNSTTLPAIIHVVRSFQSLTQHFKSPCIPAESFRSCERTFNTLPKDLANPSIGPLDPRHIGPIIYLHNARLMLYRHNMSPSCPADARLRAIDLCLKVAQDTACLLSRCVGADSKSTSSNWRSLLATSASTLLCTHLWRCILFLLFRGEYHSALVLVQASSAIGDARLVNSCCGRYISFFLACIFERLQTGRVVDFEYDEELMVYLSADLQSSNDSGWVWQDPGASASNRIESDQDSRTHLENANDSLSPRFPSEDPRTPAIDGTTNIEERQAWGGWENIERSVHFLLDQQSRQQKLYESQQGTPSSLISGAAERHGHSSMAPFASQPVNQQQDSLGTSRMTIANII